MVLDSAMPSRQRPFNPWPVLVGAALFVSGASACAPDCAERQEIRYEQGTTNATRTEYQTTPLTGPLLHFPPSREYVLLHQLRTEPTHVVINLSFEERGGNLAPSTGNQSIWNANNKGVIWLRNDTCAEFYVHLFASTDPGADPADAGSD